MADTKKNHHCSRQGALNNMSNKVVLILFLLVLENCFGQFAPDSVRVAHIQWEGMDKPIPREFLLAAKANGYNYVLCEYCPYWAEWNHSGKIIAARPTNFEKRLAQHFQQVDSAGLRLIPNLTTATPHADWFYGVCIDTLIPRQLVHQRLPLAGANPHHESFVMSPDSTDAGANRMNNAFDSLWTMVFNAFKNARAMMTYRNLDFVHLGYDENYYAWSGDPLGHIIPLAGLCESDTAWLASRGLRNAGTQTQLVRLYAANIKMRVGHIVSIAKKHDCITKAILWADMFDPDLYPPDVYSFRNLFDPGLQGNSPKFSAKDSLVKVRLVGALNQSDMLAVSDNLIFAPWVYDTVGRGGRYVPENVLDTFASRGYKILYVCAGAGFGLDARGNPVYSPCQDKKLRNALEFEIAAHDSRFASTSIGYICANYSNLPAIDSRQGRLIWNPDSNYVKPFDFLEILARINNRRTPDAFR
jgi:hypothetical protein